MIINKTPYPVHVLSKDLAVIKMFPKSETPIRLSHKVASATPIDGVPTSITTYGGGVLPKYKEGVFYIVSQLGENAAPERSDLLAPADEVRDDDGNIIGCKSLGR